MLFFQQYRLSSFTSLQLADQMLETQSRLLQAFSDEDKKLLEQRAAIIDKQIDKAVYKLYGLTDDEVKIVEEV